MDHSQPGDDSRDALRRLIHRHELRRTMRDMVWLAVATLLGTLVALTFIYRHDIVEGESMDPSIHTGEHILIDITAYDNDLPSRGDIIVFSYPADPSREFIKRVVGLPGEEVAVHNGKVTVNGKPLEEPYPVVPYREDVAPVKVPKGYVYVMGDNRPRSNDSRIWGPLWMRHIHGKARLIFWPLKYVSPIR